MKVKIQKQIYKKKKRLKKRTQMKYNWMVRECDNDYWDQQIFINTDVW